VTHTPGPWFLDPLDSEGVCVYWASPHGGNVLVATADPDRDAEDATARANALLIAAAPELLGALLGLAALTGDEGEAESDAAWERAYAAIGKAKGGAP
jgi:hypothetical protein